MAEFDIFRITEKKRGNPPMTVRTIDRSTSDEIPEGAFSIPELRIAETIRAESARHRMDTAIGCLTTRESACIPRTGLYDLLDTLRAGSVAYEPIVDQLKDSPVALVA